MLVLLLMAATIEIRRDGPPITLAQARELTSAALGDVLLAPRHPPIVEASIGPEGMLPPPPPGMPVTSEIRLFAAARPAEQPGFCEKTQVTVRLTAVTPAGLDLPPAPAEAVSSSTLYRWAGNVPGQSACEGKRYDFFALDPAFGDRSFAVIRALGAARPSTVRTISIDDQEGRSMRDYAKQHPNDARGFPKEAITPITNGRAALTQFPVSRITTVRRYVKAWDGELLKEADLKNETGRVLEAITIFAGDVWNAGIVMDGDRITTIRFVRAVPPPF